MRCEALVCGGRPADLVRRLRELVPRASSVGEAVAQIIAEVRRGGDQAVLAYTRRFDIARRFDIEGAEALPLIVADDVLEEAARGMDPAVRMGLERAAENIRRVASADPIERIEEFPGHVVQVREVPVQRAAIYVPGGRAAYPSTVMMGVLPAREAGVREIAVCAPPSPGGEIASVILAACRMAGATRVYRMGGAQAIAALAYGTESVEAVDVIVGPGNDYVQEAKRQVFGQVGVEGFAGPSDLLVIADPGSDPVALGLDLLAQAEHGAGTLVVAISTSAELLKRLKRELASGPDTGAVAALVEVSGEEEALAVSERFAPEHLELVGERAEALAGRISTAGCLFIGPQSATAFGDYMAGSNHILPTAGSARFASMLSPVHFRRRFAEVRVREPDELARAGAPVARAEGFELHARSMEIRIRQNRA